VTNFDRPGRGELAVAALQVSSNETLNYKHIAASSIIHILIIGGLLGLLTPIHQQEPVLDVMIIEEEGSEGGSRGTVNAETAGADSKNGTSTTTSDEAPAQVASSSPVSQGSMALPPRPSRKPAQTTLLAGQAPPVQPKSAVVPKASEPPPSTASNDVQANMEPSRTGNGDGMTRSPNQGAGNGNSGNGAGPDDEYLQRVRRWVAKYKQYPEQAKKLKQEGTVHVAFTVARDGNADQAFQS
jgi:outer membrane biosynthesis protein TonB